ncbi:MAG TPA: FAD-dependent oxidoreductase [Pseudolysinimonas sp.]|nr:FAD-dependent oxidoreductase [Pseudolysinimonas sp.]
MSSIVLQPRYEVGDLAGTEPLWSGDVIVVGGGSAGCAAAIASARGGARTLLVEASGFLGGTGAAVLDTMYGFFAPADHEHHVVGGIGWELVSGLLADGTAFRRPNTYGAGTGITYDPEYLKIAWDDLLGRAGAELLSHTLARAVVRSRGAVCGVVVETRSGSHWLRASAIVDATGDADIAWKAGAALEVPAADRRVQPLTATFRVGGVDPSAVSTPDLHRAMHEAAESGDYRLPRREGSVHRTTVPHSVHTNLTRVSGVDPTDPWQLSAAETEGRRQVVEYMRFLRERVPAFAESHLLGTGVRIGVRETRRLVGRHVLTRDDVMSARRFDDEIALCGAPLEDHDGGEKTIWEYIGGAGPNSATYGVPLRSLLPLNTPGLIVAGRCLSATHDAHASVRSIAQCIATGEAAGTTAAIATGTGRQIAEVESAEVRERLLANGAVL